MSALSVFLLIVFAIVGVTLFAGAVKGNYRLFRRNLIVSGIAIGISALFSYKLITARTGDDQIFWGLLGYFAQIAVCAVSGLFTLGVLLGGKNDGTMGTRLRACCLGLAIVFFVGFSLVYWQKEIATMLQRRAVATGSVSPFAKRTAWELKYWDAVAQLEPSPQKERLIGMIEPSFWPPDGFWETLLSLPPSPERLAVITAYAHGMNQAKWLAILYDQGDEEGLEVVFKKNEKQYFGYLMKNIVNLQREDILRDVLQRGSGKITASGQYHALSEAAIKNSPQMVALLLDSGISPDIGVGRSALNLAAQYAGVEVARLLLEQGADVNKNCLIMDAVRDPDMLSLLLQNGASPFCTRYERTLLHQAAEKDVNAASMTLLLGLGTPVDSLDKNGRSPFLLAAGHGSTIALDSLIAAGADTSRQDAEGDTALHLAAKRLDLRDALMSARYHAVMARLVALNPDLALVRNAEGKTPLDYVKDEKSLAILRGEDKQ